ncbi:5-formyltetrahydrofolate cyclo-ligase [Seinonella peptonophila]|uniref:5-formyltetrahydrofolate cyclo-ligase n=1 Tax=Seinonella peptonophila TaxID=112248 RepID=A0A1M4Y3K9_9BACL|nr:5-formyltetrahydrofolate cyclo-ligase [Seinonella peptonophila]SHF00278.1 5-formyltetrahydrofolate cyclo-ligase [Seinonella peptonophila]
MITDKQLLRKQMRGYRHVLPKSYRIKASRQISQRLIRFLEAKKLKQILLYWPIHEEVDLRLVAEYFWSNQLEVILPVADQIQKQITCYAVRCVDQLQTGSYGIIEPDPALARLVDPNELEAVIVPGVAFDKRGYRLGYGGGYYDRFFMKNPQLLSIGVAYPEQLCSSVYAESYDQTITILLTPTNLIYFLEKN